MEIKGVSVEAGEYVVLSVSDTDMGISADHLPHIFETFFTTKEIDSRTGLGLSRSMEMSRKLVAIFLWKATGWEKGHA